MAHPGSSLNLNDNKIGAEVAYDIGEALGRNTALVSLAMKKNKLGDEGCVRIAQVCCDECLLFCFVLFCFVLFWFWKVTLMLIIKLSP